MYRLNQKQTTEIQKPRALFICTRNIEYSRNRIMLSVLREQYAVDAITSSMNSYLFRIPYVLLKYIFKNKSHYEFIFVGFLAQPLFPLIRILRKKPIISDAFFSLYDTLCFDKQIFPAKSFIGKVCFWMDKYLCEKSDLVFLDTNQHIEYFKRTFKTINRRFARVFVGAPTDVFSPATHTRIPDKMFNVEFHGDFIPLHGTEVIARAAKRLKKYKAIKIKMIGNGQTYKKTKAFAEKENLTNIDFLERRSLKDLAQVIAETDLGLGVFGKTPKTLRVIPNKAFELISMKKPLLTCRSPAIEELFVDMESAILCRPNDADDLAEKILWAYKNRGKLDSIAQKGYEVFMKNASPQKISKVVHNKIIEVIGFADG